MPDLNPNEIMSLEGMTVGQKADVVRTSLVSDGGYMSQREFERFLQRGFKRSILIKDARQVKMPSRDFEIPTIGFDDDWSTFLIQPTYNRGGELLGVAERSSPSFGKCTLNARTFTAQVNIPWDVMRDSVEKEQLVDTIRGLIDERVMADVEKIWIAGDTTSTTVQLAVMDGLIALTSTYTVAAAGARLSTSLLDSAIALFPEQYETNNVSFYTTRTSRNNWRKELASRATALGDQALATELQNGTHDDYPVKRIPLWPGTMGGTANRTACMMADPENLAFGIYDKIPIRMFEDESRAVKLIMEVEFAAGLVVEPAVVSVNDILNTAG
jgi:HK97 family phage major capsid protein